MLADTDNLPEDAEKLKEIIRNYDQRYRILEEEVRNLKGMLFGSKSEKQAVDPSIQPSLFDEAEEVVAEEPKTEEAEEIEVPSHTRKKGGRRPIPESIPREDVVHDLPEGEKICACGSAMTRIGEEVSEKLDYIPAQLIAKRHIRPKYACRACEGVEGVGGAVRIAPMPPQIIPQGIATPGLLSQILASKYADGLPLYRQEKILERIGVDLPRATMANWVVAIGEKIAPLIDLLKKDLLSSPVIGIDETRVQVMKEPGRPDTSLSFMWVSRAETPRGPIVLFQYHPTRSGNVPREFLNGYEGYVQVDGYAGYDGLEAGGKIRLAGCWAHSRRKFMEAHRAAKDAGKSGSSDVAISYIGKLYNIERAAEGLDPERIRALRQERAGPILVDFRQWLEKRSLKTPPGGLLGKAIFYTLSQWEKLIRYLEDGRLRIDNNLVENAIRPFAVGRKNWLFSGHPRGAKASAGIYSLIETAKARGAEPCKYLRFLLEELPLAVSDEQRMLLLP